MARVPYVDPNDLDSEYRDLVVSSLQPGETLNVYRAIVNNPDVLDGFRAFLGVLWNRSGLTDRQREIVILTTAAETGSSYEWHQHAGIAADAGLDQTEIDAIARDDRRPFPVEEQALLSYTRAVIRGRVTDPLHEAAAERFDEQTLVAIGATAAGYLALARVIDALDVDIEAGEAFVGWDPV